MMGMIYLIAIVLKKNENMIIYMVENHSDMPRVVSENAWNWRDKPIPWGIPSQTRKSEVNENQCIH